MNSQLMYSVRDVSKTVPGPKGEVSILHHISLDIAHQESLAVIGASGSAKTTLLHLLGGLDLPTSGQILFSGQDIAAFSWSELTTFRNTRVGFVFQFHHLLPEFSALENVAMPGLIHSFERSKVYSLAREALDLVGLSALENHPVTTLSGGERQLTAIARAVLMRPEVILADEPTGNLDEENGELVADLLVRLNKETSTTLIVVTHNLTLAHKMGRQIQLRSGALYEN
ncbi:ABC transporter ATP-binding protein [Desulfovermiculus halophilus]|uniref:ABC transporter ATP-binding protein n=1 Tax=Desulfovermiculus halophilus TaxID=339722 RepID=UPI0004804169|nr:ABC transporter ATP-binding protein [Desulfovermiculus halophilus]